MINHARTLLMNVDGASYFLDYPGEEIVAPTYTAKTLPTYLTNIRRVLFGTSPDREMLNYRCRQFMALLHSTDLAEFVEELDPRITYDFDDDPFISEALYQLRVVPITLSSADVEVIPVSDDTTPPDASGKLNRTWKLVYSSGTNVAVTYTSGAKVLVSNTTVEDIDGVTSVVSLPESQISVRLTTSAGPDTWLVHKRNRPQYDIGEISASLESINTTLTTQLFGISTTEPFKTFKNLWERHDQLAYKLGGLLLAVIYRTENL